MKKTLVALSLAFALAAPAFAHQPTPKHGGKIVLAGEYHVEMVTKPGVIEIHLLDHSDKMVSPDGFKGLAIVSADGKSERVPLFAEGAVLRGTPTGKATNWKGVVQVTPPSGKTVNARF